MKQLFALSVCLACIAGANYFSREDPFVPGGQEKIVKYFDDVVMKKVNDLSYDYSKDYQPGSNIAKRNYRLVPPMIAKAVGLTGLKVVELAAYLFIGFCIYSACKYEATSVGITYATLCTSSGAVYFWDFGHTGDVIAQAFLAVNLVVFSPALIMVTTTLALFTDERSILLIPIVMFATRQRTNWHSALAYGFGIAAYVIGRLGLSSIYVHTNYADVGSMDMIIQNLRLLPAVIWGSLEGAWIFVIGTAFLVWKKDKVSSVLVVAYPLAAISMSLCILDMSRSASYVILLPAACAALAERHEVNSMFISGFIEQWNW